jgi:hypothetical protein
MANATGIPALFWAVAWIASSLGILWLTMRLYVGSKRRQLQPDLSLAELDAGEFARPRLPESTKTRDFSY